MSLQVTEKLYIANAIADQFVTAHNTSINFYSSIENKINLFASSIAEDVFLNEDITTLTSLEEIVFIIKNLKNSNPPGLDQITNLVLKKLPNSAYNFLIKFYNFCIQNCYFPSQSNSNCQKR